MKALSTCVPGADTELLTVSVDDLVEAISRHSAAHAEQLAEAGLALHAKPQQ